MKSVHTFILFLCISTRIAVPGDDASGPIPNGVDLSQPFTLYVMSKQDNEWSASLVNKSRYKGVVVHFVRTSLPLKMKKRIVMGAVYQAFKTPSISTW
jgi:hypothetical protein